MKAWKLAVYCILRPHYDILICDDSGYPGTNWTDEFVVETDDIKKVIRIMAECT